MGVERSQELWIGADEYLLGLGWGVRRIWVKRGHFGRSSTDRSHTELLYNVAPRDQRHWAAIRAQIKQLAGSKPGAQQWVRAAYKAARRAHYESRKREWHEVLPPGITTWAAGEIARAQAAEPCADNARVGRLGNTSQMRRYRRQKRDGCCGFAAWTAKGPDGRWYALGFNFGH